MNIGMLWFDNDTQTGLDKKVIRAASYYQKKYGQKPNLCFVHPCMLASSSSVVPDKAKKKDSLISSGVEIKESVQILPNHFWIGVDSNEG